ncbi:MAG TPA: hypothetical protein VKP30_32285, partial [Polyangiaceae bacterium]|nr:hypothetical protein [Polyangiaceae bacterium]
MAPFPAFGDAPNDPGGQITAGGRGVAISDRTFSWGVLASPPAAFSEAGIAADEEPNMLTWTAKKLFGTSNERAIRRVK